jgi:hypothetical protein
LVDGRRFHGTVEDACCDTVPATGSCALDRPLLKPVAVPESWSAEWVAMMEREIVRLPPSAFTELPIPIQKDLTDRNCTIPQVYDYAGGQPRNVISGSFQDSHRSDWAVLCSIASQSRILIYKAGSATDVYEVPKSLGPDSDSIQGGLGFSRIIDTAGPEMIRSYKQESARLSGENASDGSPSPPIEHDGIEDGLYEKASSVLYWHDGDWLVLPGPGVGC